MVILLLLACSGQAPVAQECVPPPDDVLPAGRWAGSVYGYVFEVGADGSVWMWMPCANGTVESATVTDGYVDWHWDVFNNDTAVDSVQTVDGRGTLTGYVCGHTLTGTLHDGSSTQDIVFTEGADGETITCD